MKYLIILIGTLALTSCKKEEKVCVDCQSKQYYLVNGQRIEADELVYNEYSGCFLQEEINEKLESKYEDDIYKVNGSMEFATRVTWTDCKQ